MKKHILYLTAGFFIISCGSDNDKYTVSDDGNGTHSPRISKVTEIQYLNEGDGNITDKEYIIEYSYNNQNMISEKKDNFQIISYVYSNMKQIILVETKVPIARGYEKTKFIYGDVLYAKTKKPIVIVSENSHGVIDYNGQPVASLGSQINYDYEYNDNGEATQLKSSQYTYLVDSSGNLKQYMYNKSGKIIQENFKDKIKKKYTYNTFGKLSVKTIYHYNRIMSDIITRIEYSYDNKHLIVLSKEYDVSKTTGEKELVRIKKYSYENKPYYSNPSPNHLDQGQYSSSGIY